MAIAKDIAIHGSSGVDNVMDYTFDETKTDLKKYKKKYDVREMDEVDKVFTYAENLDKTVLSLDGDEELLVSGVGCSCFYSRTVIYSKIH